MRRARWKRKNVRRVGLRKRRPPAAGGGRLAVPRGSQRRKRAALGETSTARGSQGYPQRLSPLPLTLLRRTASGSEKRSSSMRQPPRRRRHHPPRDASIDLVEESSVPEGQAKSALAPIRRPPCARRATAPERANAFLFGPCTARFSFGKTKEKWGVHPGWTSPPAGADTTVAAVRRPLHACVHRPLPPSSGRSTSDPWVA